MGDAATPDQPVSVVVASRNRPQHLSELLTVLDDVLRPQDELVIVDSASSDPGVAAVLAGVRATVVRLDRPGLSRARNAGVARTTHDVIAFTDDDCRPESGWTRGLAAAFQADPGLGFATGRVRADHRTATTVTTFDEDQPLHFRPGEPFGAYGHGANFAVRRRAFDVVGPFDEGLGAGTRLAAGEDIDMFWRMLRAGWSGAYRPEAAVVHVQWRGGRGFLRVSYNYGLGGAAVAVKRARLEHRRSLGPALAECAWRGGLRQAWRDLRAGYETGAVASVFRGVGGVVGAVSTVRLAMDRDCFDGPVWPPPVAREGENEQARGGDR